MASGEFWQGVLASIVAAFFVFLLVQIRTRIGLKWSTFSHFWLLAGRLKANGVANFFASRSEYARFRKQPTVSDYIATTQATLTYVGFWLAQGLEIENVTCAVEKLLERGCTVEFVLLDPTLTDPALQKVASYLGLSVENLKSRLDAAWRDMSAFRARLAPHFRNRFHVLRHSELLTASGLLFDFGRPEAKVLVDHKLYGVGREGSYGIELVPAKSEGSLFDRVTSAFLAVRRAAYAT